LDIRKQGLSTVDTNVTTEGVSEIMKTDGIVGGYKDEELLTGLAGDATAQV